MKISNETKVGALTAITITLLVLSYNFLQGKKLFDKPFVLYAVYETVDGLADNTTVKFNGLPIGTTGKMQSLDERVTKIIVPIFLNNKNYQIPKNSIAIISGSTLGINSAIIDIKEGDATTYFKNGDTIRTNAPSNMIDEVTKQLNPVLFEVKTAVHSLDSVLNIISGTFDPNTKSNFQSILRNVDRTTANLINTSNGLNTLITNQAGTLSASLQNVEKFTTNLNQQNAKINTMLGNLEKTTDNFAALKLDATLVKLNGTMDEVNGLLKKFGDEKGTVGKMLHDPDLYNQLHSLTYSINTLVDDLKVNPKRYVSLLGRKDKKIQPLKRPLSDTTAPNQ